MNEHENSAISQLAADYLAALRLYNEDCEGSRLESARNLGETAIEIKRRSTLLPTLELQKIKPDQEQQIEDPVTQRTQELFESNQVLQEEIQRRKVVEESVELVHRFARDLRPSLLDDLGLIPALESYLKSFMEDTGIRVELTAFAEVEQLDNVKRTVLYRVAQEALLNVAQHAQASQVEVKIEQRGKLVRMDIHDYGKGFQIGDDLFFGKQSKRLGLLGMRERVEMIGGSFSVESTPGKETTARVEIPSNQVKHSPNSQ